MCGRYTLYGPQSRLRESFQLSECPDFAPRYNIPPQTTVVVIRQPPGAKRIASLARWGLIPAWAKDPAIGRKLNNARAETVAEKPSFRSAFRGSRCLIPANGFFEWAAAEINGKLHKQPYYISPLADGGFFAFAGLLERWQDASGQEVVSTCVITTTANATMAPIHERMPVIISGDGVAEWLDPANHNMLALQRLLLPAPADSMRAFPVGSEVNRASNESAELIRPLAEG